MTATDGLYYYLVSQIKKTGYAPLAHNFAKC